MLSPSLGSNPPAIHPIIYDGLDAQLIRRAALHTTGAGGPSGTDAHCWRRLCSAFKRSSDDLCHSLSLLARKLCSEYVDPKGLSAFLACHLVALDKNPGIQTYWRMRNRQTHHCESSSVLYTPRRLGGYWFSPTVCGATLLGWKRQYMPSDLVLRMILLIAF